MALYRAHIERELPTKFRGTTYGSYVSAVAWVVMGPYGINVTKQDHGT